MHIPGGQSAQPGYLVSVVPDKQKNGLLFQASFLEGWNVAGFASDKFPRKLDCAGFRSSAVFYQASIHKQALRQLTDISVPHK